MSPAHGLRLQLQGLGTPMPTVGRRGVIVSVCKDHESYVLVNGNMAMSRNGISCTRM
jgi:hypothetical protein